MIQLFGMEFHAPNDFGSSLRDSSLALWTLPPSSRAQLNERCVILYPQGMRPSFGQAVPSCTLGYFVLQSGVAVCLQAQYRIFILYSRVVSGKMENLDSDVKTCAEALNYFLLTFSFSLVPNHFRPTLGSNEILRMGGSCPAGRYVNSFNDCLLLYETLIQNIVNYECMLGS